MQNMGKLPPQAVELEHVVLGGLILENGTWPKVVSFLKSDHFYVESHKIIYEAALGIHKSGNFVDMQSLVVELRRLSKLEIVGGAYYVAELTSKVSQTSNIEYNARILVEMAIKRGLIVLAGNILQDAYSDTSDCFEVLQDTEDHIKEINSWIKK